MVIPEDVKNKRQIIEQEKSKASLIQNPKNNTLRLTKHLKEIKLYGPAFTGSFFHVMHGNKHALALNDDKVSLIDIN